MARALEYDAGAADWDVRPLRQQGEQEPRQDDRTQPGDTPAKSGTHDADDRGGQPKRDGQKGERPKRRWPMILLIVAVIAAIVAGVIYWLANRGLVSTDDAYTDGNSIVIAPKVAGYVSELRVSDNSVVKKGQLLYRIDPRDYVASRDQAEANVLMARAQLDNAEINLDVTRVKAPATLVQAQSQLTQSKADRDQAEQNSRRQHTVDPRATTQTNIDQATAQLRSNNASVDSAAANVRVAALVRQSIDMAEAQVKQMRAQVAQADANLRSAEINLSYTEIRAPDDGRITQRSVNEGNYVQAGQQSCYVVTPTVWVTANYKETQLADMRPGQTATIAVDAYPNLTLEGHVDSIQQGSGAQFSAFPAQNATGNFVKIVRRVPVKLVIDRGLPEGASLPLGISVNATVDTR